MTLPTIEIKSEGLILVSGLFRTHAGLWSLCTVRNPFICQISGKQFAGRTEAYRPLSNSKNRMHRIANSSVKAVISGDSESLIRLIRR